MQAESTPVVHRPTTLASALAVLIAVSVVLLIAGPSQALPVLVTFLGLVGLGVAAHGQWGDRTGTILVGLCGAVLVGGGFATAIVAPLDNIAGAVLYPGLAGMTVLCLGLLPIRTGWETALATAGAALLFVSVLNSGVTYGSSRLVLLAAMVGVVAAWDAARHAITLGDQVGRQAVTGHVELAHVGATLLVGGLIVVPTELVWRVGVTDLPLVGLVGFLGAAIAFLVVLYR